MKWKVLDTGSANAFTNMQIDADLLKDLDEQPLLHFYEWERNSLTYGHFLDPHKRLKTIEGLDIAKRPTGGGMLFHIADFAFSVLVPKGHPSYSYNILERYRFINEKVKGALAPFIGADLLQEKQPKAPEFCMATPTEYDLMVGQRKVAGAAQRRTNRGYLHQGSISLGLLSKDFLLKYLDEDLVEKIHLNSYAPLGYDWTWGDLADAKASLKFGLLREFRCEGHL